MEKIDSEDPLAAQSWIMVENINSELKNELLEKEFSQHGKVCDIQRFAATPGAASIQYEHPSSAASAIQNADGSILAGKVLSVKAKNHLKNGCNFYFYKNLNLIKLIPLSRSNSFF